jgi:hypothetical protein
MLMKNEMQVSMNYDGGIVLFDPKVFCDFLEEIKISSGNIFDLFIQNKTIGDIAIDNGYILAMYPIEEDTYNFLKIENSDPHEQTIFEYKGFPLMIESGILVATDIFSLIGWEHDFFRNYTDNYKKKTKTNDMIEINAGLYSIDILGLKNFESKTYGLRFNLVQSLPKLSSHISSDDFDFNFK